MQRLTPLAALTIACLLAAACGSAHNTSASRPTPKPGGAPVLQSPAATHSGETSLQYGSAAAPSVHTTLTTTNGNWTGRPTTYRYRWQQCDSRGANCTDIAGARSNSYTLQSSEMGATIRVAITANDPGGSAPAYSAVTGVVAQSPPASTNVTNFNITDDADDVTVSDAAKDQIVQLQYSSTVHTLVKKIHNDDPGVKVLMYSDPTVAGTGGSTDGWTTCTTSAQDVAGGNAWYLYDGSGRIGDKMNFGDAAYDAACTRHAEALAKSAGFDGVFWDEVNPYADFAISSNCVEGYQGTPCWNTPTWQTNMYRLVQAIGSTSSASGLMAIINDGSGTTTQWDRWAAAPGISGSMEESFVGSYTGNSVPYPQWQSELADEVWSEANHKYLMGVHYDPHQDQESLDTFGLATMLLAADGYSSYNSTVTTLTDGSYNWWPEYTTAEDLGAPTGAYTTTTSGSATIYERKFANGIVVANPTTSLSGSVALGQTYTGTGNEPTNVSSVTLPAQTGLVLTRGL
jgi:hypothetical protein